MLQPHGTAVDQQGVASLRASRVSGGSEFKSLAKISLGSRETLQLSFSHPTQQVKPHKIAALAQAGSEQHLGLGGMFPQQLTDSQEVLSPEMARLQAQSSLEGTDRLLQL